MSGAERAAPSARPAGAGGSLDRGARAGLFHIWPLWSELEAKMEKAMRTSPVPSGRSAAVAHGGLLSASSVRQQWTGIGYSQLMRGVGLNQLRHPRHFPRLLRAAESDPLAAGSRAWR